MRIIGLRRKWRGKIDGTKGDQEITREHPMADKCMSERGSLVDDMHYLYCANTFDQRQLVMIEEARAALLDAYYQEILRGLT